MAFLPEKTNIEENLITAYDLSTGVSTFTSSDISKFTSLSLQFTAANASGSNSFAVEQSIDNTNWSILLDDSNIPVGDSNFFIDKSFFSGKYIRVRLVTTESGTLDCLLLAKR